MSTREALSDAALRAIGGWVSKAMDEAVENGANSVSMPDEYVELAIWLDCLKREQEPDALPPLPGRGYASMDGWCDDDMRDYARAAIAASLKSKKDR